MKANNKSSTQKLFKVCNKNAESMQRMVNKDIRMGSIETAVTSIAFNFEYI